MPASRLRRVWRHLTSLPYDPNSNGLLKVMPAQFAGMFDDVCPCNRASCAWRAVTWAIRELIRVWSSATVAALDGRARVKQIKNDIQMTKSFDLGVFIELVFLD